jgi:peptidyl-prolyl cis-trans isomerase C
VVAKGKGFEIKRGQLDEALISIKSAAVARGQAVSPAQLSLFESQLLEHLIQVKLLVTKATEADLAKGLEASNKQFESIKSRAGTEEALNRQLKSVGMTQENFRTRMVDEATAEAVLERELKINVSDDEIAKFYEENPSKFEQPEMVRASHILLSTRDKDSRAELTAEQKAAKRKQMEGLLKRARDGEDFTKLAKEFSEDPGVKENSGEYTFARASADPTRAMVPEFEAAAFSLKTNQVSDIVTTQFGYHIIKLSEKLPAKKVELAKVSPDIRNHLKQVATTKQMPDYMEKLKKDGGVEILDEKLKQSLSATPSTPPSAAKTN